MIMGGIIARLQWWRKASDEDGSSSDSCSSADSELSASSVDGLISHEQGLQSNIQRTGKEQEAPIQKLPADLVLRIFSFLDVVSLCRCAQVCKDWNMLALDGSNWQHVDLFDFQTGIEEAVMMRLSARCGNFLRTLSLRGCEGVEDKAVSIFSQNCPLISKLSLRKCVKLTDNAAASLSQHCNKLSHLDFCSCRGITDATCEHIASGCPLLQHIDLSYCSVGPNGLRALLIKCDNLSSLVLQYCTDVTDEVLRDVGTHSKCLTKLNIQGCKSVSDAGVHAVSEGCPNLESLSVSRCDRLSDVSLRYLGNSCPKLRDLEAAGCAHFGDSGFAALASGCGELKRMDLEECILITDATLSKLAQHCPQLQRLVLSHCERITDAGIRSLVSGHCADELQVLELDNCPLITDQSLEMLRGCVKLRRVEVFDCQTVSRFAIHKLQRARQDIKVHAYFPPNPSNTPTQQQRTRRCNCCSII